jgi:CubicO group peptidase (beta-lactamase class C family)
MKVSLAGLAIAGVLAWPVTGNAAELMAGAPPPADALVTTANWLAPGRIEWSFQHIEALLPSATVDRGAGSASALPVATADLGSLAFDDLSGKSRDFATFLTDQHVDALLIAAKGKVVQEVYRNHQTARDRHIVFSVTKSFTGLITEMLIDEGAIDETKTIPTWIPELRSSAWGDATVRQVLDMEVGIAFTEVYDDPTSDIGRFGLAAGFTPAPAGYEGPASLYDYLPTLKKQGDHGKDFHYVTANTEVLGWVVERVTGKPFAKVFEERIYSRLGAERDAFYAVDPHGKAIAGGGLNLSARDMLRLALMMANDGKFNGQQIVPAAIVARIAKGGTPRPSLWGNENGGSDHSYRSQWYIYHPTGTVSAAGIHGQTIHVSRDRDVAMVVQSSYPDADGPFFTVTDMFFEAVAKRFGASGSGGGEAVAR